MSNGVQSMALLGGDTQFRVHTAGGFKRRLFSSRWGSGAWLMPHSYALLGLMILRGLHYSGVSCLSQSLTCVVISLCFPRAQHQHTYLTEPYTHTLLSFLYQKGDSKSELTGDVGKSKWLGGKLLKWLHFWQIWTNNEERWKELKSLSLRQEDIPSPPDIIFKTSCPNSAEIVHNINYTVRKTLIFASLISIPASSSQSRNSFV